jgi:hypothetical protein
MPLVIGFIPALKMGFKNSGSTKSVLFGPLTVSYIKGVEYLDIMTAIGLGLVRISEMAIEDEDETYEEMLLRATKEMGDRILAVQKKHAYVEMKKKQKEAKSDRQD